ncbi:MAG: hypothetical protein KGL39_37475 [Patescibacteria group bacterium]|nr:hypothetical protein [Patescibacteria group bacterium]
MICWRPPTSDRWPAAMRGATAAAYLDMSITAFREIANRELPAIQHDARGDRYWLKEDLDAYLEARRRAEVTARKVG